MAACVAAELACDLAIWIGGQLPASLFEMLQGWVPRDQSYRHEEVNMRPEPILVDALHYAHIVLWAGATFVMQALCLFLAAYWIRCFGWPENWRDFDSTGRRDLRLRAWWMSSLCLIATLPVVGLVWLFFFRIMQAGEGDRILMDFEYFGSHVLLDFSSIPYWLNRLAIPVITFLFTTHVLTRLIRGSRKEAGRKCMRCRYSLTQPVAMTCPECGLTEEWPFTARVAWSRIFADRRWNKWVLLLSLVPLLMLMAPVILPQMPALFRVVSRLF